MRGRDRPVAPSKAQADWVSVCIQECRGQRIESAVQAASQFGDEVLEDLHMSGETAKPAIKVLDQCPPALAPNFQSLQDRQQVVRNRTRLPVPDLSARAVE